VSLRDAARVTVLIADYVAVDAAGKLTTVGAGFTLSGVQPDGTTAPQHVAVLVDVPGPQVGEDFALGVALRDDESGEVVLMPRPDGQAQPLQVAQVVRAQPYSAPGLHVPSGVPGRVQLVLGFPTGLPLEAGRTYRWVVELDGATKPEWSAWFHVPGAAPGPVFGGPVSPTTIPRL
jgi:hypothetical protein